MNSQTEPVPTAIASETASRSALQTSGGARKAASAPAQTGAQTGAQSATLAAKRTRSERIIAAVMVLVAVGFNLFALRSEISVAAPPLNDAVMHMQVLARTVTALSSALGSGLGSGQNLLDPWMGNVTSMGIPLFHFYQHLPYYPVAAISIALSAMTHGTVTTNTVYLWSEWLLIGFFPVSILVAMRRFGFSWLQAGCAALVCSFLSTNFLFGLEYGSYVWRGSGMYTALWGMVLLPLALAQSYYTLCEGRGYLAAVALVAATVLSHVVTGYVALGSIVVMAILVAWDAGTSQGPNRPDTQSAARRRAVMRTAVTLVLLLALVAVVIAYFLIPFVRDGAYMNRSIWELPEKYDSYGARVVLGELIRGELLDFGRPPVISLLALVGMGVCLWRWRELRYRIPVVLTLLWLLLYFGRPTWGVLLNLLPLSENLHLHRLILGFHLGSMWLAGIALALPWEWALGQRKRILLAAPAALTLLLLIPLLHDRSEYMARNEEWMERSAAALAAERPDLTSLIDEIRSQPPGRVYAGLAATWGKDYKVGDAPLYAVLTSAGLDVVGQLYQALSLNSDLHVRFQDGVAEQYNLFNIRYVLTPANFTVPAFYTLLGEYGRHKLYSVPTTGYFDVVHSDMAFAGDKSELYPAAWAWMQSDLLAEKEYPAVFLEGAPAGVEVGSLSSAADAIAQMNASGDAAAKAGALAPPGSVITETVGDNAYAARIRVGQPAYALLKATYHPDWRATVDGVETPTVMLMPSYIGVPVAPGEHEVRLTYQQEPLRGWLALLGVLTLAAVGAGEWWLRRRGRKSTADSSHPAAAAENVDDRTAQGSGVEPVTGPKTSVWAGLRIHLPWLAGVLIAVVVVGLPLLQMRMMAGHDSPQYITRAVEFYRNLVEGNFLPVWAPDLSYGYGEPFFQFNPPLIYGLTVVPHALGASWIVALDGAILLLLAAAGLGMYLFVAARFGPRGGFVAAVAYLLAPYFLSALYVRQALADFSAFAPLPFAFWGVYEFARQRRALPLIVGAAAVAILLLASNPVALMGLPALVAWGLWLGWQARSGRALGRAAVVIGAGMGLSVWFWGPAFVDRATVQTANLLEGYLNYSNHFVYPIQFLYSPWGYGLSYPGLQDGMSYAIGPIHLLAAAGALGLLWWGRKRALPGRSWLIFFLVGLAASLFFASTLAQPVWDRIELLQILEFAWRFLTMAAFCTAVLCGAVVATLADLAERRDRGPGPDRRPGPDRWVGMVIVGAAVAGLLIWGLPKAQPSGWLTEEQAVFTPEQIAAQGIAVGTANEYTPVWVTERPQGPAAESLSFVEGEGSLRPSTTTINVRTWIVDAATDARLRASTFYFPGWRVFVDGVEQPIAHDNPQGLMEFAVPAGQHAVRLVLEATPVRQASLWISLLALVLCGLLVAAVIVWPGREEAGWKARDDPEAATGTQAGAGRVALTALGLYLICFAVYFVSGSGHFSSTDQISVYQTTRSLAERGEIAIDAINDTFVGADGRTYGVFGIGQSLASVPLYLLGRIVEQVGSPELNAYWSGTDIGQWGGTVPIYFVSLFNQLVTPLICVLVFLFCLRLGFSQRRSLAIAFVYAFGTAAWVYAREYFQHPLETLTLLAAVYILFARRDRLRPGSALLSGALLGFGVLVRLNLIVLAPILALYIVLLLQRDRRAMVWALVAYAAPIAAALAVTMGVNDARFGSLTAFRPDANAERFSQPVWIAIYGFLFSPGRSIFLYSPPVILAPFAWVRFWRARRLETLLFTALIGATVLTYSLYTHWHGDWAYGPRMLVPILPFVVIPLAWLLDTRPWRIAVAVTAVLGAAVQILGVTVNYGYIYWQWNAMALSPADAYLWDPSISAIPMHLKSLLAGRDIDLRLDWVARTYGYEALFLTVIAPLLALAAGGWLVLRNARGGVQGPQPPPV